MGNTIFFVLLIVSASGLVSPPIALAVGLVYGFAFTHPYRADMSTLSKFLLKASVVCLGFGMNLHEVLRVGRTGFSYTALSITAVMLIGLLLGRLMGVGSTSSFLDCGRDSDLRWQRYCCCRADYPGKRRGNGGVTEHDICPQLHRAALVSRRGLEVTPQLDSVWPLVGASYSRHELRCWSCGEVRTCSARNRYDSKACARTLDCAPLDFRGSRQKELRPDTVALVYPRVYFRGRGEYLSGVVRASLFGPLWACKTRPHGHAFPHRHPTLPENSSASQPPTASPRYRLVGDCRLKRVGAHRHWMDFDIGRKI
jgi:hypothetical protein